MTELESHRNPQCVPPELETSSQHPLLYVSHMREITPKQGNDISQLPLIMSPMTETKNLPLEKSFLLLFSETDKAGTET